jgi:hypothetical protein
LKSEPIVGQFKYVIIERRKVEGARLDPLSFQAPHLERSIPSTASSGSETDFSSPLSSKGEQYVAIPFLDASPVFQDANNGYGF